MLTGAYAAGRDGVDRSGRLRAGTALITRGEFSIVVIGLVGAAADPRLGALVAAYVMVLAVAGPILTRCVDGARRHRTEVDPHRGRGRRTVTPRIVHRGDE